MASRDILLDLTHPQIDAAIAKHHEIADIGDGGVVFLEISTLLEVHILIQTLFSRGSGGDHRSEDVAAIDGLPRGDIGHVEC